MIKPLAVLVALTLAGCGAEDETFTAYTPQGTYQLSDQNGQPASYTASLTITENGAFSGQAPCNSYSGTSTVPYPWFKAGAVAATKMACPDLAAEAQYFATLGAMTLAESSGAILILSNDNDQSLTFLLQE